MPFLLLHLNTQSPRNKFYEFSTFLDSSRFPFDVIILTETWYKVTDVVDTLDNYAVFSLNRSNKNGGGVCVHVKESYEYHVIHDLTKITNDYESLTLQCAKSVFSVVYRPPGENIYFLSF